MLPRGKTPPLQASQPFSASLGRALRFRNCNGFHRSPLLTLMARLHPCARCAEDTSRRHRNKGRNHSHEHQTQKARPAPPLSVFAAPLPLRSRVLSRGSRHLQALTSRLSSERVDPCDRRHRRACSLPPPSASTGTAAGGAASTTPRGSTTARRRRPALPSRAAGWDSLRRSRA